jgi:hypothetical protein
MSERDERPASSDAGTSDQGGGDQAGSEERAGQERSGPREPEPHAGPQGDENDDAKNDAGGDEGTKDERDEEANRPRRPGHRDEADAPDSPGSEEFRRRDRTTRRQRRFGQQNLSGSARGIGTVYGPTSMGDGSVTAGNIHAEQIYFGSAGGGRIAPPMGPLDRVWLDDLRDIYADTTAFQQLVARLPHCRVQVLQGSDGSGRTTTAALALHRCVEGQGKIGRAANAATGEPAAGAEADEEAAVEVLDAETNPGAITDDDLHDGYGYLLDRSATTPPDRLSLGVLNQLRRLARDHDAFFVLIVDDRTPLDRHDLRDYLVSQVRPDLDKVLHAHLEHLLRGKELCWTDELDTEVKRELRAGPAIGRVVDLAAYLADATLEGLPSEQIVAGFRVRLLAKARAKLASPFADDPEEGTQAESLCRQALLLTCAVLNQLPLVTVTQAATNLAERLHAVQTGGELLPRPIFGGGIERLLRYVEATDRPDEEQSATPDDPEDVTRRVSMHNPGLPAAVLEVAWDDYDTVREPLLDWLRYLVTLGSDALQVRAAIAVGKLASYDFEYIYHTVIRPWAASPHPTERWAAAWALEMAANDERLESTVRDRVKEWCREFRYRPQRTALLAFGAAMGQRHVEDALEGLCLLAPRPWHARDYALALSLREIFLAGAHEEVRTTLADWAEQGKQDGLRPLVVQAARCLLTLSQDTGESDDGASLVLLGLFIREPKWRETLTRLWRLALTDAATSQAGWIVLRRWLRRAAEDAELVEPLVDLVAELVRDPHLRDRARFYRRFWRVDGAARRSIIEEILTRALGWGDGPPNQRRSML